MPKVIAGFIILCMASSFLVSAVDARERVALIVGNGGYQSVASLPNPSRDAEDLARTLKALGFTVTTAIDVDQESMRKAVMRFGKDLDEAGPDVVGFFYYAGHAVQVKGANYLIPTDASIANETQLTQQGVHLAEIAQQMKNSNISASFMVIDACRNNPFDGNVTIPVGLAQVRAPRGSIVAYSTEPGAVALDGDGQNSPYTAALIQEIAQPGIPVEQMFKRVRRRLLDATALQQISWESSSLTEDLYFVPGSETVHVIAEFPDDRPKHDIDWENYDWRDLTELQRKHWSVLDWTTASWDGEAPEPDSEYTIWDNLSAPQQQAAALLGYSKPMWDGTADSQNWLDTDATEKQSEVTNSSSQNEIDWEKYDWDEMSAAHQSLWSILGWDAARWSGDKSAPATESMGWADLTATQKKAAVALGFPEAIWDESR